MSQKTSRVKESRWKLFINRKQTFYFAFFMKLVICFYVIMSQM